MKIFRFCEPSGRIGYAAQLEDGFFELDGELFEGFSPSDRRLENPQWLAPLVPSLIIGIGLNYRFHAEESGAKIPELPIVFTKFPGALQHPGAPIFLPRKLASNAVDYECELAVVLGRHCLNATRESAFDFVFGYTAANDVSARDWQIQKGGSQWSRGKSFDSFCPLGPCLVTKDEIPDPNALSISTTLNEQKVQNWNTRDMIFDVPALIEFLSADTTLPAGTVILTGTPQGVGMARTPPLYLQDGDTVSVEIENIGFLTNPVRGAR